MRSRVIYTAVAAIGMLCAAGIATGAWAIDTDFLLIADVPEPAIWGMVVVGFGLFCATFRRCQSHALFT